MQVFLGKEEEVCDCCRREGGVSVPATPTGGRSGVLSTKLSFLAVHLGGY